MRQGEKTVGVERASSSFGRKGERATVLPEFEGRTSTVDEKKKRVQLSTRGADGWPRRCLFLYVNKSHRTLESTSTHTYCNSEHICHCEKILCMRRRE